MPTRVGRIAPDVKEQRCFNSTHQDGEMHLWFGTK